MTLSKTLITILILCLFRNVSIGQDWNWWADRQEIATDYNTCLHGVKDSLGNWVIQPQYENIEESGARYVVNAGGKYGLMNRRGQILIPMQWDFLRCVDSWYFSNGLSNCYDVLKNGYWGVVDTIGRVIVPVEYLDIKAYYDSSFTAKKSKNRYDFYHYDGKKFECPWKQKGFPTHDGAHTYILRRRTLGGVKYGMVNDSGEVLFERKYDELYGFEGTGIYKIRQGNKYGYCSSAGKMLWPIVFSERQHRIYFTEDEVAELGIGPAYLNNKCGLISIDGKTILPFEYDYIIPFDDNSGAYLWEVGVGMLSGIYDINKGWLLQPKCHYLFSVNTYTNAEDTSFTGLLIANQNGKWGAMTTSGQAVIPFECESMLMVDRTSYVFQKGDSLLALSIPTFNLKQSFRESISPIKPFLWMDLYLDENGPQPGTIPSSNQFSVFNGKNGVKAFYHPGETKDTMFNDSTFFVISQGKYYGMSVPDSIVVSCAFAVIPVLKPTLDHEQFDLYGAVDITDDDSAWHYTEYCVMRNHTEPRLMDIDRHIHVTNGSDYYITEQDDLLKENGTVIFSGDTMGSLEDERHAYDGSLYFTHVRYNPKFEMCAYDTNGRMVHPYTSNEFEDFTAKYTWADSPDNKNQSYQLIDNKTGLNILGKKTYSEEAYPIWDSITIVESKKVGNRLFNTNQRQYFTTYGFDEIIPLRKDGSLFAVRTCSRNIGVVDASGKVLLDTIYTAITAVNYADYLYTSSRFRSDFFERFYGSIIFYNDRQQVCLDIKSGTVIPHPLYIENIWNQSAISVKCDTLEKYVADSIFESRNITQYINIFMREQDSVSMLHWQKQCIVDSSYTPVRELRTYWSSSNYRCDFCRKTSNWSYGPDWSKHGNGMYYYLVGYRSDSLLCFSRFSALGYQQPIEKEGFSTSMLFKDGVHQMTLDSLFDPASDWRNFVINTLISYVNNHMNIEGDCHNPAGIPLMLNEQFEITPEGINLYPPEFEENNKQLVLTIPWQAADPYLRKDIKSRLPIPK